MKTKFILLLLGLLALLPLQSRGAGELDYGYQAIYSAPSSFPTASASNINTVVNCTMHDQFSLFFLLGFTNLTGKPFGATSVDVSWSRSDDGINFNNAESAAHGGWFSIPLTNQYTTVVFSTNITMNVGGYYRVNYLTNQAGIALTGAVVRAYFKPKRSGTQE